MKKVTQTIIYLTEIIMVTLSIITLYSKFETGSWFEWKNDLLTLSFLSNFGIVLAVYQLIIYSTSTLIDSAKIDAFIKIHSLVKSLILFVDIDERLVVIQNEIEMLLSKDSYYMFEKENLKMLQDINQYISDYQKEQLTKQGLLLNLEYKQIEIEHFKEFYQLQWRNSIVLRYLK